MTERIRRADLRELLIRTGVALLLERGLECGLDSVTFPDVFARVKEETGRTLTRASVYDRVWTNQEEFQWEVLATVIEEASSIDERTRRRIRRLLKKADNSSEKGRWAGIRSLCQAAVEQHVIEASERQHYRIVVAAVGAIASSTPQDDAPNHILRVRKALHDYLDRETDLYVELYTEIGAALGFRMIEPLELRQFVLALGALGDGIAMRLNYFPEYATPIKVPPTAGDATPDLWSLAGIGVEAIAHAMLEIDPDWPHG